MGVGITDLEVELAEKLVEIVPSFERVLLTLTGTEATFHAVRLARAATGRQMLVKFQGCYHGWHDAVAMNVISPAAALGGRDTVSRGILPGVLEATIVCRWNDLDDVRAAFEAHPDDVAAMTSSQSRTTSARSCPSQASSRACARCVTSMARSSSSTRSSPASATPSAGTRPSPGYGRIGYPRQGDGEWLPRRGAGRSRGPHGSVLIAPRRRRPVRGNLQWLPRGLRRGPSRSSGGWKMSRSMSTSSGSARWPATGSPTSADVWGCPPWRPGCGSVFCTYFLDGDVRSYDDLLRNDVELYVGYRLESVAHGVFELPMNLKRSHMSYAHTEDDVTELLETAEASMRTVLDRRVS